MRPKHPVCFPTEGTAPPVLTEYVPPELQCFFRELHKVLSKSSPPGWPLIGTTAGLSVFTVSPSPTITLTLHSSPWLAVPPPGFPPWWFDHEQFWPTEECLLYSFDHLVFVRKTIKNCIGYSQYDYFIKLLLNYQADSSQGDLTKTNPGHQPIKSMDYCPCRLNRTEPEFEPVWISVCGQTDATIRGVSPGLRVPGSPVCSNG